MAYKTPMLQQYEKIKERYPDCLLFFRLGDFYELFGDDAKIGSEVLHITLTARDKGSDGKVPMCGVPFHASENYVARLVQAGYKVAICEQMTAAGKGLVEREVVRVVTAGTMLRDESLTDASSSWLLSLVIESKAVGGAAADLSTGEFKAFEFVGNPDELVPLLVSHFTPKECIVPRGTYDNPHLVALLRREQAVNITCAHDWLIYTKEAEKMLKTHFGVASLDSFGLANRPLAIKGAAALLGYLKYTQKGQVAHITAVQDFHFSGHLILDPTTLRHLEVVRTSDGQVNGSLLGSLNQTMTAAGQRLLQEWLVHPVTNKEVLVSRHEAITELLSRSATLEQVRVQLAHVSDIERLVGRLSVGLGLPRDLRRLADTVWHAARGVVPLLAGVKSARLQALTQPLVPPLHEWVDRARSVLFEEAKPTVDEGFIFQSGFDAELDTLRSLTSGNQVWLQEFEASERERTGIPKLRVVYSRAFGYAIEVSKANKDRVPPDYAPRQTLVNAERYTCQALVPYEQKALSAMDQMIALERQLFGSEVVKVVSLAGTLTQLAHHLAELDVLATFTWLSRERNYVRPSLGDQVGITIKNGRHPVIEQLSEEPFIANDTHLSSGQSLQLITGPNMAGKSTYIRQVALIALLAHTGCFVPADEAVIGLTDRIFTRIGAHDNLRAGQSTFMVEMLETAHILHNATDRSLVILDEVGRGTSPEDGFALAWAIAESLAQGKKGLVLFATHFHALKDLADAQPNIFNSHLAVAVDQTDLIFLRKVVPGPTDESFGIVVAQKAGLPKTIIRRAEQLASTHAKLGKGVIHTDQLSLLAAASHTAPARSPVEEKLEAVDINSLTPLQALQFLNELKEN